MKKVLTKTEEEIMQVLWKLDGGFLRDIVNEYAEPKPHQNTVATILKILEEKKFVGIESYGRINKYIPLISKQAYSKGRVKSLVGKYFDGSFSNIVSSMVHEKNLSVEELEMLVRKFKSPKKKKNK